MRAFRKNWTVWLVVAFAAVVVVLTPPTVGYVLTNQREAQQNKIEANQTERLRRATYRICSRANSERAFGQALVTNGKGLGLARAGLPIMDCSPNFTGGSSEPLPQAEQTTYVQEFVSNPKHPTPLTCKGRWQRGSNVYDVPSLDAAQTKCEEKLGVNQE